MGIQIMLVVFGVTLFAGLFFALLFSYREREAELARPAATVRVRTPLMVAPSFFAKPEMDTPVHHDLAVREIEHHLRQELMVADLFLKTPSMEALWLGRQPSMVAN